MRLEVIIKVLKGEGRREEEEEQKDMNIWQPGITNINLQTLNHGSNGLWGPAEDMWSPPCPSLPTSIDITVNKYNKTVS